MNSRVYADDISHEVETPLTIVLIAIMSSHEKEIVFLCPHTLRENELNYRIGDSKADDGHGDVKLDDGHGDSKADDGHGDVRAEDRHEFQGR